jgi:hypothetical protein
MGILTGKEGKLNQRAHRPEPKGLLTYSDRGTSSTEGSARENDFQRRYLRSIVGQQQLDTLEKTADGNYICAIESYDSDTLEEAYDLLTTSWTQEELDSIPLRDELRGIATGNEGTCAIKIGIFSPKGVLVGFSGIGRGASPDRKDNEDVWIGYTVIHPKYRNLRNARALYEAALKGAQNLVFSTKKKIFFCTENEGLRRVSGKMGWLPYRDAPILGGDGEILKDGQGNHMKSHVYIYPRSLTDFECVADHSAAGLNDIGHAVYPDSSEFASFTRFAESIVRRYDPDRQFRIFPALRGDQGSQPLSSFDGLFDDLAYGEREVITTLWDMSGRGTLPVTNEMIGAASKRVHLLKKKSSDLAFAASERKSKLRARFYETAFPIIEDFERRGVFSEATTLAPIGIDMYDAMSRRSEDEMLADTPFSAAEYRAIIRDIATRYVAHSDPQYAKAAQELVARLDKDEHGEALQ